ncbi:thymidine kinase [Bacillus cereus]|uniref:thymidine kinase n=1 Tax=Bacillus cereus TaxID=1396 RepID=UPI000BFCD042|nr:thymidine kinase [Bacillus cereus]PGT10184.1 thymidine kinase [Bacillus cereus]
MAKVVFYYGSMNSSKSAQLIMTAFNFEQQGKNFEIVKSSQDTRDTKIKSRALSIEMDCTPITHFTELLQIAMLKKPDWLFVDEVQFMDTDMIDTLSHLADDFGINVVAYGLMTDFQGQLFEGSKRLVESADSIREIKNQCIHCENKANRNVRLVNNIPVFEGEVVQVGGNESYSSVCRRCYNKIRRGSKAA